MNLPRFCLTYPSAFLASPAHEEIKKENPHMEVMYRKANGRHPLLLAEYVNGTKTPITLRNLNEDRATFIFIKTKKQQKKHSFTAATLPFWAHLLLQRSWSSLTMWITAAEAHTETGRSAVVMSPHAPRSRASGTQTIGLTLTKWRKRTSRNAHTIAW